MCAVVAQTDPDFVFADPQGNCIFQPAIAAAQPANPLGPLDQGTSQFLQGGPPHIPDNNIILQSALAQLDFNGLRWPHVTVATLHKQ